MNVQTLPYIRSAIARYYAQQSPQTQSGLQQMPSVECVKHLHCDMAWQYVEILCFINWHNALHGEKSIDAADGAGGNDRSEM